MEIIYLAETESTNDYAKKMENAANGLCVVADRQLKGKGTKGRGFVSPLGGLYMSVIMRPNIDIELLTPMAAVAVRRAIKRVLGVSCGIKWVNDLYLNGKKVCGILTENKFEGERVTAVIGIGIDVFKPTEGYGEYSDVAAYLSDASYTKNVITRLAETVRDNILGMDAEGTRDFLDEYREASVLIGESVYYTVNGVEELATAVGIDDNARLVIRYANGKTDTVNNGDIVWKK